MLGALAVALGATPVASQQPSALRVRGVTVSIRVESPDLATVVERLDGGEPITAVPFQFLADPCAAIDSVRFVADAMESVVAPAVARPWTGVTPAPALTARVLAIEYRVRLAGATASIPIVMPAVPLAGGGSDVVAIRLTIDGARPGKPVFPAMHPVSAREWETHFAAMPSVVRVSLEGSRAPCRGVLLAGSGGFLRVFFAFVAVLALWVPLYLWWARTSRDSREA